MRHQLINLRVFCQIGALLTIFITPAHAQVSMAEIDRSQIYVLDEAKRSICIYVADNRDMATRQCYRRMPMDEVPVIRANQVHTIFARLTPQNMAFVRSFREMLVRHLGIISDPNAIIFREIGSQIVLTLPFVVDVRWRSGDEKIFGLIEANGTLHAFGKLTWIVDSHELRTRIDRYQDSRGGTRNGQPDDNLSLRNFYAQHRSSFGFRQVEVETFARETHLSGVKNRGQAEESIDMTLNWLELIVPPAIEQFFASPSGRQALIAILQEKTRNSAPQPR